MIKNLIVGISIFLVYACGEQQKAEFSLKGITNGIEDGTVVYLVVDNESFDSATVINNTFDFNSKLPQSPLRAFLHNKDYSQYRFLWLEIGPMMFDASNSDFKYAIVTGSEAESLSQTLDRDTDSLPRQERLIKEFDFVKEYPNSIVSAHILSVYSTTWGKAKTMELFDLLSKENKESEYGQKIKKYIELNKDPKIGDQFVDFEMESQDGTLKKLSDVKGKVVLLEFWASWCGPCREENPHLVSTYERYQPKGFEIFAVSLDDSQESWINAIEKDRLNWTHVSDLKGSGNEASLIYGVNGIPANFLIAESGEIVGRNLRGEELNQKLAEILN